MPLPRPSNDRESDLTLIVQRGRVYTKKQKELIKQQHEFRRQKLRDEERSAKRRKKNQLVHIPLRLESLPAELLQEILFYCMEVNFPLASPTLAAKLSSETIYMKFAIKALYRSDLALCRVELSEILRRNEKDPTGLEMRDRIRDYENRGGVIQSSVLKTKWMTFDFYSRYLHQAYQLCKNEFETKTRNGWMNVVYDDKGHTADVETGVMDPVWIQDEKLEKHSGGSYIGSEFRYAQLMSNCRLPEKLFRTPFQNDQLRFLKYLVFAGAKVDWHNTSAGEFAESALEHAIEAGNLTGVKTLIDPSIGISQQRHYLEIAYKRPGRKLQSNDDVFVEEMKRWLSRNNEAGTVNLN
ncbi:MAG: hypothetical protein M1820_003009 [Bogoriella megaspora]|nr:MAG: hypothetical protein M1820_003009 [Bogoriella megaspora]